MDASVEAPCPAGGDCHREALLPLTASQVDNSVSTSPADNSFTSNVKTENVKRGQSSNAVDLCRLFVFTLLLLYLIRSNFQWTGVNTKISNLERKIDLLDKLLNQVVFMK